MTPESDKVPTYCWFALAVAAVPAIVLIHVVFCLGIGVLGMLVAPFPRVLPVTIIMVSIVGIVQFSLLIGMLTFPIAFVGIGVLQSSVVQKRFSNVARIAQDPLRILRRVLIFNFVLAPILMCLFI